MQQLLPWSGLGGFLVVVGTIALPVVLLLVWLELTRVTRALWAIVSQFQAVRREHGSPEHGVANSMFGR